LGLWLGNLKQRPHRGLPSAIGQPAPLSKATAFIFSAAEGRKSLLMVLSEVELSVVETIGNTEQNTSVEHLVSGKARDG
jgi:hypothetical protein